MTYPAPTEPGFYWARYSAGGLFMPVETYQPSYGPPLRVLVAGRPGAFELLSFTWGPRITMPEDLAVEDAGR